MGNKHGIGKGKQLVYLTEDDVFLWGIEDHSIGNAGQLFYKGRNKLPGIHQGRKTMLYLTAAYHHAGNFRYTVMLAIHTGGFHVGNDKVYVPDVYQ